jgi:hypothetical protein
VACVVAVGSVVVAVCAAAGALPVSELRSEDAVLLTLPRERVMRRIPFWDQPIND